MVPTAKTKKDSKQQPSARSAGNPTRSSQLPMASSGAQAAVPVATSATPFMPIPVISHMLPLQSQALPQSLDRKVCALFQKPDTELISAHQAKNLIIQLQVAYQTELRLLREQHELQTFNEKAIEIQRTTQQSLTEMHMKQLDLQAQMVQTIHQQRLLNTAMPMNVMGNPVPPNMPIFAQPAPQPTYYATHGRGNFKHRRRHKPNNFFATASQQNVANNNTFVNAANSQQISLNKDAKQMSNGGLQGVAAQLMTSQPIPHQTATFPAAGPPSTFPG